MPDILLVRLGSLGDIVHTFPAVASLRQSFPASRLIWLTHPRWKFLVESSRLASEVWSVDTRSLASLRQTLQRVRQSSWDAAIDYQGLWKSAALPFLGAVPRRIGFSSATVREFGVPVLYTDSVHVTQRHVAEQNGELSVHAGAKSPVAPVELHVPEVDHAAICDYLKSHGVDRYVVLSPGGGWRSKCWPAERFGALCHKLREIFQLRCVVNIGPGEDDLSAALRASSGDAAPLIYRGSLGELMALLRGAACVVGGDTGPVHLAAALGTPCVALFGPTNPDRNGPYRVPAQTANASPRDVVLRAAGAHTSHKRRDQPDSSILALSVEQVFDAVKRCLGLRA